MMDRPELSLIMPAYNEGDNINLAIERVDDVVRRLGLTYELIVVDDGSVDNTRTKVINYANGNAHVRLVGYEKNMGKGYALKTGIAEARGDVVISMDSDSDIDAGQIISYLKALKYGDIVIASKRNPKSHVKAPLIRKLLSFAFNVLVRLATGLNVSDTQSGLKAFRAEPLRRLVRFLTVKKFAWDVEVLTVAKLMNLKIIELPVTIELDAGFSLRHILRMLVDLAGIAYRLRVKRWYQNNLSNTEPTYNPIIRW